MGLGCYSLARGGAGAIEQQNKAGGRFVEDRELGASSGYRDKRVQCTCVVKVTGTERTWVTLMSTR